MSQVLAMTIAAKYEDGVFKPLESVEIREGTIVEVRLPLPPHPRAGRRSVREFAFAGMWKDRPEMADSVEYVNRLRDNLRG
jgi:predicted DNA-binding antitoxin AbrB/MazE fold protein